MKEKPIIFSRPMVLAILEGRKTQTRRIVKPKPDAIHDGEPYWNIGGYRAWRNRGIVNPLRMGTHNPLSCPYGDPGTILWVRESWRIGAWDESQPAVALDYCDGPRKEWIDVPDMDDDGELFDRLWQQSTDDAIKAGIETNEEGTYKWQPGQSPCRWRPSIHMPRWASRITLEITNVRVERLNEISEEDAEAEGIDVVHEAGPHWRDYITGLSTRDQVESFRSLWESINGAGSWESNPFVWVIEFRKI